jgi:hypothetical protein
MTRSQLCVPVARMQRERQKDFGQLRVEFVGLQAVVTLPGSAMISESIRNAWNW